MFMWPLGALQSGILIKPLYTTCTLRVHALSTAEKKLKPHVRSPLQRSLMPIPKGPNTSTMGTLDLDKGTQVLDLLGMVEGSWKCLRLLLCPHELLLIVLVDPIQAWIP